MLKIMKIIKKALMVLMLLNVIMLYAKNEDYHNKKWCNKYGGETEVTLRSADRGSVRIDCLLDDFAVETDYARKWAEAIGQSLYYAEITGKKPAVLIIMKSKNDDKHVRKIQKLNLLTIFRIQYEE